MNRNLIARRVCAGLFVLYVLIMVYLLFLQRTPQPLPLGMYVRWSTNLVPFYTIRQQMRLLADPGEARWAVVQLAGNVIMFVPLGLLPAIWQKQRKFGWYFLTVAVAIILVEVVQLLTKLGSADIDDWLLNVLGAVIGFEIWRTIGKICRLYL